MIESILVAERGRPGRVLRGGAEGDQEGAEEGDWLGDKRAVGSPQTARRECEPEVRHGHIPACRLYSIQIMPS